MFMVQKFTFKLPYFKTIALGKVWHLRTLSGNTIGPKYCHRKHFKMCFFSVKLLQIFYKYLVSFKVNRFHFWLTHVLCRRFTTIFVFCHLSKVLVAYLFLIFTRQGIGMRTEVQSQQSGDIFYWQLFLLLYVKFSPGH